MKLRSPLGDSRTRLDIDVVSRVGLPTVLQLEGDLDLDTTPRLRSCGYERIHEQPGDLVIDLSGVTFCDSTALGLFLGLHRCLADRGGTLELVDPPRAVRELLTVTGLDQVISVT